LEANLQPLVIRSLSIQIVGKKSVRRTSK